MNQNHLETNIYVALKIIIIIAGLNWGLMAIDNKYNIFELFASLFMDHYKENVLKIIYIIITLSTLYVMFHKKTYYPLLESKVILNNKLLSKSKKKDFQLEIVIDAKNGEKVIYWASYKRNNNKNSNKNLAFLNKEYGTYDNSGISLVDKNGRAKIYVKCPTDYYTKFKKILPKYVHYRIIYSGKLGKIKTINLTC